MKRLLALFLLLLPIAALAETEDILLPASIQSANSAATLCEAYNCVRVDRAWVFQDGSEIPLCSYYAYSSEGGVRLAQTDNSGNTLILGSGMGFSVSQDVPTVIYYPSETLFENAFSELQCDLFGFRDKEEIVSAASDWDGTLTVVTETKDTRGTVQRTYLLEGETLRIQSLHEKLLRTDGASALEIVTTVHPEEAFSCPEALTRVLQEKETYTVRLVTENSELIDITYPRAAYLAIAAPDGYGVYADAEGTIPAVESDSAFYYLIQNTKG